MKAAVQLVVALVVVTLASSGSSAQSDQDREFVREARRAYYHLKGQGLKGFTATVQPTWGISIKNIAANPEALKMLQAVRFMVSVDEAGTARLSSSTDTKTLTEDNQRRIKRLTDGVDQIVSGFFATWRLFMFDVPLPPVDGRYHLGKVGENYLLTYNDGHGDVATTLRSDFYLIEMKVSAAEFQGSIKPRLVKTDRGFVINGYQGQYEPAGGSGKVMLDVQLDHQDVSGFKLPLKLRIDGTRDGGPTQTELVFSQYAVRNQ
jgi:hypothetical protein